MTDQTLKLAEDQRPSKTGSAITIRELATPAFYHWRKALIAFLIPVLLALAAATLAQPVYTAQSRLLILLGDDYVFRRAVGCLLYTSPSPRDATLSRMPSSA